MGLIVAAEALKPGTPVLNRQAKETVLNWYSALFEEVGMERFKAAYEYVMQTSKFRPDISELREAAGAKLKSRAEIERGESQAALTEILRLIRKHTWQLRTIPGAVIRDVDLDGRIMNRADWVREPNTESPRLDPRVVETVRAVGTGDFWAGMRRLATHPSVQGADDEPTHPVEAKRIEDRWHEAFREFAR